MLKTHIFSFMVGIGLISFPNQITNFKNTSRCPSSTLLLFNPCENSLRSSLTTEQQKDKILELQKKQNHPILDFFAQENWREQVQLPEEWQEHIYGLYDKALDKFNLPSKGESLAKRYKEGESHAVELVRLAFQTIEKNGTLRLLPPEKLETLFIRFYEIIYMALAEGRINVNDVILPALSLSRLIKPLTLERLYIRLGIDPWPDFNESYIHRHEIILEHEEWIDIIVQQILPLDIQFLDHDLGHLTDLSFNLNAMASTLFYYTQNSKKSLTKEQSTKYRQQAQVIFEAFSLPNLNKKAEFKLILPHLFSGDSITSSFERLKRLSPKEQEEHYAHIAKSIRPLLLRLGGAGRDSYNLSTKLLRDNGLMNKILYTIAFGKYHEGLKHAGGIIDVIMNNLFALVIEIEILYKIRFKSSKSLKSQLTDPEIIRYSYFRNKEEANKIVSELSETEIQRRVDELLMGRVHRLETAIKIAIDNNLTYEQVIREALNHDGTVTQKYIQTIAPKGSITHDVFN